MLDTRQSTQPVDIEQVQQNLERTCCLYEELDIEIKQLEAHLEKLNERRTRVWSTFTRLQAERKRREPR